MDWPTLIISGVATLAAVASAIVAIVQAREAARSKKDAEIARSASQSARDESAELAAKATDAFIRSAAAQEEANEIRRAELAPPDWTGPTWVAGDTYKAVNSSGRTIMIESFDLQPEEAAGLVHVDKHDDGVYKPGESFSWLAARGGMGGGRSPETLTASWRYQDEPDDDRHSLIIPL